MLNSEAAQSLPHLSGTLCSNRPCLCRSRATRPQFPHSVSHPGRWRRAFGLRWTQICKYIQGRRPSPALHPTSERQFWKQQVFLLSPPWYPPLPLLRNPVSSWNKPFARTFLEDPERPAPGSAASGLLRLPRTFSGAGTTASTPYRFILDHTLSSAWQSYPRC